MAIFNLGEIIIQSNNTPKSIVRDEGSLNPQIHPKSNNFKAKIVVSNLCFSCSNEQYVIVDFYPYVGLGRVKTHVLACTTKLALGADPEVPKASYMMK